MPLKQHVGTPADPVVKTGDKVKAGDLIARITAQTCRQAGLSLVYVGIALLFGCILLRGLATTRAPWGNMYEFSIAFATGILLGYLFLARRYQIRSIAFVPIGVALFLVGYAATLPSRTATR